jgi:AcrR family transcriptional regulator
MPVREQTRRSRRRDRRQLPPGRHGLSAGFVAQNQRERIIAALARVCARKGYVEMSVEDVIADAGVSRRTFYEHFKNKEHAFLSVYDEVAARLLERVSGAVGATEGFNERIKAGLSTFLGYLADEPDLARLAIVEVLAAGPEAVERRNGVMRAFATLIEENARRFLPDVPPAPGLVTETMVGGIYEVVYTRVVRGEVATLPALVPDLAYSILLPYAGTKVTAPPSPED